jgi:hypothetical protein
MYVHCIYIFVYISREIFKITLFTQGLVFYSHVEKNLHDHTISLRVDAWAHKTSLTPPLFIVMLEPR